MDARSEGPGRDEIWRMQQALDDLSATQQQHSERIMRLEKRQDESGRSRGGWGGGSPFPPGIASSQHESSLNPAAEAFRNFDADPPTGMITSLTLDTNDDQRRAAAASRANSVRFDESANNHYGHTRSSIDLPTRTGSGLGSHPLSERSSSHRSERGSTSGFGRTNSFGLETSRLLGSIHNSPRVSGNPAPGFFVLGPCPAIVRCWLTETFSNDSLLYAAACTGSSGSSISLSMLQKLGMTDSIIEENGVRKVKLLVYLTEAKICLPSSRSASPAPQVPTVTVKFFIHDHQPVHDKSIQLILGSDVLRERSADLLFSQDKLMIYDDDRNQLSIPLVRPEDDAVYKNLSTRPRSCRNSVISDALASEIMSDHSAAGVIGRPNRANSHQLVSPSDESPFDVALNNGLGRTDILDASAVSASELNHARTGDDSKSTTGSEKSATAPASKSTTGVWANSWRSSSGGLSTEFANAVRGNALSSYSRPSAARTMKVLRPSAAKGMGSATRVPSSASPMFLNGPDSGLTSPVVSAHDADSKYTPVNNVEVKPAAASATTAAKTSVIGGGSAFPWLAQSQQRRTTTK